MKEYEKIFLLPDSSIHVAIKKLDKNEAHIVLIVDDKGKLLGTVTDGDVRRGILKGYALSEPVSKIMNAHPIKLIYANNSNEQLVSLMENHNVQQLPLIDRVGKVIGLKTLDELLQPKSIDNLVVIMSGGEGKRMLPLTHEKPKPMLTMGGKPLLEVIIANLQSQGFKRFCFTVGYKAEIIKEYFGDGQQWGVSIDYIHEQQPLGTAGALRQLTPQEQLPVLVMNGDLLTTIKLTHVLKFHEKYQADCTICIREFAFQLPYGVVEIKSQQVTGIQEKPEFKYFVNAGMYVINPQLLTHIPHNRYYQMTSFLDHLIALKCKVEAFPLMEYWSDIGQLTDYEKACREFEEVMQS